MKLGCYMSAYSERKENVVFHSINPIVDTSEDVEFLDLGDTLNKNSLFITPSTLTSLGELDGTYQGFEFKIDIPPMKGEVKNTKIGLYNIVKKNPWRMGYLLYLSSRENGNLYIELRTGDTNGETVLMYLPELQNIDYENVHVMVWLTDVDVETNMHVFHVKINGEEVITYQNLDGKVKLGPYLSAYTEVDNAVEIKAVNEVQEPIDLYLSQYGDPTAMNDKIAPEEKDDTVQKDDAVQKDYAWIYLVVALMVVVMFGGTIIMFVKRKKKANLN